MIAPCYNGFMKNTQTKRDWFTTITAGVIGLVILAVIFPTIPIVNWTEITFFGIGMLLVIICATIAIEGKEGKIKEIVYSMRFWP